MEKEQKQARRPMRRKEREVHGKENLLAIVSKCHILHIGAADEEGLFIVPVNFGYEWEEKLKFYIHSAKEGRKAEAFLKNPSVAVELDCEASVIKGDCPCSYSESYQSLMGNGTIRLVEEDSEKEKGLICLMKHNAPEAGGTFVRKMLDAVNVYCIEIDSLTGKERKER